MSDQLNILLASTYSLYLKTQNFHWNIESREFFELHELFEQQYTELANDIDIIAEFIRILDKKVVSGLNEFAKISLISDASCNLPGKDMVKELINDYDTILQIIIKTTESMPNKELGIKHQLSEMFAKYQKTNWMLKTWHKD